MWWVVHDGTNSLIALGEGASGWTHHVFDNDDDEDDDTGDHDCDDDYDDEDDDDDDVKCLSSMKNYNASNWDACQITI